MDLFTRDISFYQGTIPPATAGASEHGTHAGATDGASEHGTHPGATDGYSDTSRSIVPHPGARHDIIFCQADARRYKKGTPGHGRKAARGVLEDVIHGNQAVEFSADGTPHYIDKSDGASEHIRNWSDWRNYIANLNIDVIGVSGITRLLSLIHI